MKQILIFLMMSVFLGAVGCEKKDEPAEGEAQTQKWVVTAPCPVCARRMMEDTYCAGCNAVATTETDLVHCEKCNKDFKPGTYCAQCNRFMLNARVHCGQCRDQVAKGHYCTTEKLFKGLPDIGYCERHERPYRKSLSCPRCEKEGAETQAEGK
jgi:hypothetical protein